MTSDETQRRMQEYRAKALEAFPFKLIETTGDQALARWQELKSEARGVPVILGGDEGMHAFDDLLTPFGPNGPNMPPPEPVDQILRSAASIRFPDDLARRKKAEASAAAARFKAELAANPDMPLPEIVDVRKGETRVYTREETIAAMNGEPHEPPLGEWPEKADGAGGLSIAFDMLTNKPLPKVYIGVAPTDDWTAIPAFLRWGGWNDCPPAEFHVAAMRAWRDRYGAELVAINNDTMNLRVTHRPKTREEALALARDQYVYCTDIIDQGTGTYSALAADLMANDWWYFWWD